MRARHRHINPVSAAATFAWDTRYDKDGVANNGAVGTWTDRGGSTATQGTAANKPLWKTAQINGQPAVAFDGSNDSLASASKTKTTGISVVAVGFRPWTTAKYAPVLAQGYGATAGVAFITTGSTVQDWTSKDMILVGDGYTTGRAPRAFGPYGSLSDNSPQVMSAVLSSSTARIWFGGVRISTRTESAASVPSGSAAVNIGGNSSTSDYGNFSLGLVCYWISTALSDSLRRRLEHAAAYSFKLACA